jgi:hypothetical protein
MQSYQRLAPPHACSHADNILVHEQGVCSLGGALLGMLMLVHTAVSAVVLQTLYHHMLLCTGVLPKPAVPTV